VESRLSGISSGIRGGISSGLLSGISISGLLSGISVELISSAGNGNQLDSEARVGRRLWIVSVGLLVLDYYCWIISVGSLLLDY
jgi:hypothetical protein